MSVPLREIYYQFQQAKIKGQQKSKDNFFEIERALKFFDDSGFNYITAKSCAAFLEVRRETLGDYALQQSYQTIRHFSEYANLVNDKNQYLEKRRRRFKGRRTPVILNDTQVDTIMTAMRGTCISRPLSAHTYRVLIGVLYISGMRIDEALVGLKDKDVNLDENYIYVRPGKSPRDRYVPITSCASKMLAEYREIRLKRFPGHYDNFFRIHTGIPKSADSFRTVFNRITAELGYRSKNQRGYDSHSLVPHDLRHSYATNSILQFHRNNLDVMAELPKVSMILGHESPRETYWYIQAVPEILAEILRLGESS